jgi:hypothetical protein
MMLWYMRGATSTHPGLDRQQYRWRAIRDHLGEDQFRLVYLDEIPALAKSGAHCDVALVGGAKCVAAIRDTGRNQKKWLRRRIYMANWQRGTRHLDREFRALEVLESDAVILGQSMYLGRYRERCKRVYFVDRGFDPNVFYPSALSERNRGIVFCGNVEAFGRERRLELMAKKFPGRVEWLRFRRHVDMAAFLRSGDIGWNQIQKLHNKRGINYRVWEVLGSGILLLTNRTDDVARVLKPGRHAVFWHDDAELIEKARYYLKHRTKAHEIAKMGHGLALKAHTWAHRAEQTMAIVEELR